MTAFNSKLSDELLHAHSEKDLVFLKQTAKIESHPFLESEQECKRLG